MAKIILIGPAHPYRGGLAIFNERLAMECVNMGHYVEIWTFTLQYPALLFPGKSQYSDSDPPKNLTIVKKIHSLSPWNWYRIAKALIAAKPNYVVFRYWTPFLAPCLGTIAKFIKHKTTGVLIGLVDNIIPHERSWIDKKAAKYFSSKMDGFITMSEDVMKDLQVFTDAPIIKTPHPMQDNFGRKVDQHLAKARLQIPPDTFLFLYFGFIRKYKGVDILIEAINALPKDTPPFAVIIAGEFYADKDLIDSLIKSSPRKEVIYPHTHFIGNEDVKFYFSAADCVIQPYRSATQSGVTPMAYHFEVPMIVTKVGGLPEYVPKELGIVCEPTVLGLSNAMSEMFYFPKEKFSQCIIEAKKKLSWVEFVKKLLSITK